MTSTTIQADTSSLRQNDAPQWSSQTVALTTNAALSNFFVGYSEHLLPSDYRPNNFLVLCFES
jgi:hypothetical protein